MDGIGPVRASEISEQLFEGPYQLAMVPEANHDVSTDSQRFLMLKPVRQEQTPPTQINGGLKWYEELKGRVPTGAN